MAKKKKPPKETEVTKPKRDLLMPDEEFRCWKSRVELALRHQQKHGNARTSSDSKEGRWDENFKAMAGDFGSEKELGKEAIDVNMVHPTFKSLLSPMWTTDPYITVTANREKYVQPDGGIADNIVRARLTEIEMNFLFARLQVRRRVVKRAIHDCFATNSGFAYCGYTKSEADLKDDQGEMTEWDPFVLPRMPFIKRISPRNVIWPTGYELEEAPWVGVRFLRNLDDVQDDYEMPDLKADVYEEAEEDVQQDGSLSEEAKEYATSDQAGYVFLTQIWDKRTKKLITITDNATEALDVTPWPFDIGRVPVARIRFNYAPEDQFGMPELSGFLPQQKELNMARTKTRKRENRSKSVVFIDNDLADEAEKQYKEAEDGAVIRVPLNGADIRTKLSIDQGLPPAASAYQYGQVMMNDIYVVSGLGAQQRGSGDPNIRSATASANVEKWAQIRQSDYGDAIRDFYLDICKILWMLLKENPDEKRDMLITGPDGTLQRLQYSLGELEGDFGFNLDVASLISDDPRSRVNNATARYNMLRQDPLVQGEKLIDDFLKATGVVDTEAYLTSLQTPDAEFQKMQQGLPVQANEKDDHQTHVPTHDAQAQQLETLLTQMQMAGQQNDPNYQKIQLTLALMMAHVNDHARLEQLIESKQGKPNPGDPVSANAARALAAGKPGAESAAEMNGQPVDQMAPQTSPAGIPVH